MPRRNRVDPFGRIVAHAARGTLMGNRGCLHDDHGTIVRQSGGRAWISCLPSWPGVRRRLMQPGRYTELFFLDEATALAAGHRPCGQCRPDALRAFKQAWQRAHGLPRLPSAPEIDTILRAEGRLERCETALDALPSGTMVLRSGSPEPWLVWQAKVRRWTFDGYGAAEPLQRERVTAITPASMIAALLAGYDWPDIKQ